jgi:large subunit ribosomal protein L3
MARGLLAKKLGMSQLFDESGRAIPVTVLQIGLCKVTQLKTVENDTYSAVQVGFQPAREITMSKPEIGHCKSAGTENFKHLAEFRDPGEGFSLGQELKADLFKAGQIVKVSGTSKGKGFEGSIKQLMDLNFIELQDQWVQELFPAEY